MVLLESKVLVEIGDNGAGVLDLRQPRAQPVATIAPDVQAPYPTSRRFSHGPTPARLKVLQAASGECTLSVEYRLFVGRATYCTYLLDASRLVFVSRCHDRGPSSAASSRFAGYHTTRSSTDLGKLL